MSAFVVSEETIHCVVNTMAEEPEGPRAEFDELGRRLWQMNVDAVNARYSEKSRAPTGYAYRARRHSPVQQYKAVCCLLY
jgi:hypothetical protein